MAASSRGLTIGFLEIPTRDAQRAARFFQGVFDWQPRNHPWSGGDHVELAGAAPGMGCGLVSSDSLGHDSPTAVVHVADEDMTSCLERVEAAGGSVVGEPRAVDGKGRFALFRDPDGNVWGLWASS